MKKTHFHSLHTSYGAKMVSFAGFEMPIQYPKGIIHEHKVVRNAVGVFDVSHMGEFEVRGNDALAFLQKISHLQLSIPLIFASIFAESKYFT
jgi:aminomethyltransferase